jgi:peptidyl-prolyl cis-trans isomerase SurA
MGNQMSKIVKLVDIIPAHVASLEDDYIRLEEMALVQKQEAIYDAWLEQKRASMYIYIDPDYRSEELRRKGWVK